eukprot:GHVR01160766.1.p1 GENE.GHVR01160766.1~~GHVR01160766.1.p1  ORF type:complete len:358 (-),score=71.79 GHVR01160766.1:281-1354(-)
MDAAAQGPVTRSSAVRRGNFAKKFAVKCRGLPWSATKQDLVRFFQGYKVIEEDVIFGLTKENRLTGDAWVLLDSKDSVDRAHLNLHKKNIGSRYVEVFESTCDEFRFNERRYGEGRSNVSPPRESHRYMNRSDYQAPPPLHGRHQSYFRSSDVRQHDNVRIHPPVHMNRHDSNNNFPPHMHRPHAPSPHDHPHPHPHHPTPSHNNFNNNNRPPPHDIPPHHHNNSSYGGGGGRQQSSYGPDRNSGRHTRDVGGSGRSPYPRDSRRDREYAVLRMVGLPYSADDRDIVNFFQGFHMLTVLPNSSSTYVEFSTPEEADRAQHQRNRAYMGSRYIELFKATRGELADVAGGLAPRVQRRR